MYIRIHTDFIRKPLLGILQDGIYACASIQTGIENYPLGEYFFQSLFLRMTGAQEQKLKCICWELATNDYEYRYEYLNKSKHGECSSYSEKCCIYKDIICIIKKTQNTFAINDIWNDKKSIIRNLIEEIVNHLQASGIIYWKQNDFLEFIRNYNILFQENQIANNENCLLENKLHELYDKIVYNHRNRCAHNLASYQQNLPSLESLCDKNYVHHSYFNRFTLLIILDEIFIKLYEYYLNLAEGNYE